jgi:hypothetical protein
MSKRIVVLVVCLLFLLAPSLVFADRGMIVMGPEIELDQSAQNAIIAWNGKEEILILSTDVRAAATGPVLEIIPLPSSPQDVEEASFLPFVKLAQIVNERGQLRTLNGEETAGVEVTFHKKVGAHDIIVVHLSDLQKFLDWVNDFILNYGFEVNPLPAEFIDTVEKYLTKGIKYFVFDLIEPGTERTSIKPLIYRFKTTLLYYPLAISASSDIGSSRSKINLFIITDGYIIDQKPFDWAGLKIEAGQTLPIILDQQDLKDIDPMIAELFQERACLTYATYQGPLDKLDFDLLMTREDVMEIEEPEELEEKVGSPDKAEVPMAGVKLKEAEEAEKPEESQSIISLWIRDPQKLSTNIKAFFASWLWWEWPILGLAIALIILEIILFLRRRNL